MTAFTIQDVSRRSLGWRPRPAETTIVETAESLRDLGPLERHQ
jgi:dihydroflavonol-4-reductase